MGITQDHIVVIGDGIIGKLTALELLKNGFSVLLAGTTQPNAQASKTSGGILSPLFPWQYSDTINTLSTWSQSIYEPLSKRLHSDTGIDCEWKQDGMLQLNPFDEKLISSWQQQFSQRCYPASIETIREIDSKIDTQFTSAYFLPDIAHINPIRLLDAITAKLNQYALYSFLLISQLNHIHMQAKQHSVNITLDQTTYTADKLVICAGAWTNHILSYLDFQLPITPVKGQILQFAPIHEALKTIVIKNGKYIVPRKDGSILAGSTTELETANDAISSSARELLYNSAIDMVPTLTKSKIQSQWSGIRPGSPGGIPYIGSLPKSDRIWINAGHYRNGINLAPASAKLLTQLILKQHFGQFSV